MTRWLLPVLLALLLTGCVKHAPCPTNPHERRLHDAWHETEGTDNPCAAQDEAAEIQDAE